jgi:hypothetical protein
VVDIRAIQARVHPKLHRRQIQTFLEQAKDFRLQPFFLLVGELVSGMTLSRYGLCDAEIISPAAKGPFLARSATPGVVVTPANSTFTPRHASPLATASAILGPDSRVSIPITTW